MKYNSYIVDASVILGFILKEKLHKKQIQLFFQYVKKQDIPLFIPSICIYEIANTLCRLGEGRMEHLDNIFSVYTVVELHEYLLKKTFALMESMEKVSFYDASYHALAIEQGGIFITADKRYYNLAKQFGHIQHIEEYT